MKLKLLIRRNRIQFPSMNDHLLRDIGFERDRFGKIQPMVAEKMRR